MSNEIVPAADEAELRVGFRNIKRMGGTVALLRCLAEIAASVRIGLEVLNEADK